MFERIKAILSDDTVFYGLLILLIGITSFGLGRWSAGEGSVATEPASIIMSEGAARPQAENVEARTQDAVGTSENAIGGQFVGSKNSDKYHLLWCPGAQRIKEENKVWFPDIATAEAQGYAPAGNCPGL